jgi:hypothetical protein
LSRDFAQRIVVLRVLLGRIARCRVSRSHTMRSSRCPTDQAPSRLPPRRRSPPSPLLAHSCLWIDRREARQPCRPRTAHLHAQLEPWGSQVPVASVDCCPWQR